MYFICKLFDPTFLIFLHIWHNIWKWIVVGDHCILVLGFVQKLKGIVLCIFEKLGNGLKFIMKGNNWVFFAIFKLEGKQIQHLIRMRHVIAVVVQLINYLFIELFFGWWFTMHLLLLSFTTILAIVADMSGIILVVEVYAS